MFDDSFCTHLVDTVLVALVKDNNKKDVSYVQLDNNDTCVCNSEAPLSVIIVDPLCK